MPKVDVKKKNFVIPSSIENLTIYELQNLIINNLCGYMKSWDIEIYLEFKEKGKKFTKFDVRVYFLIHGAEYAHTEFTLQISNKLLEKDYSYLAFELIRLKDRDQKYYPAIYLTNWKSFARAFNLLRYVENRTKVSELGELLNRLIG
jgi:hypothetical protein